MVFKETGNQNFKFKGKRQRIGNRHLLCIMLLEQYRYISISLNTRAACSNWHKSGINLCAGQTSMAFLISCRQRDF